MDVDEARLKVNSALRRAGLSGVPRPVIACVAALCILLVAFALVRFWPSGITGDEFEAQGYQQEAERAMGSPSDAALLESSATSVVSGGAPGDVSGSSITVDVEGAVKSPGVYEIAGDSRIADAVDAAGGLSRSASRTSVNLAQRLQDGEQVYVATKKEAAAGGGSAGGAGSSAPAAGGPGATPSGGSASANGKKVNLNTASSEELQTLSGIGPALAQRIIDYRESKGGFKSVEGLKEVSGIGDVRFSSLKDSVCV